MPQPAFAEPPPETTKFRIAQGPFICYAPQMVAKEFLQMEGFTDVTYIENPGSTTADSVFFGQGRHDDERCARVHLRGGRADIRRGDRRDSCRLL
jgi:hypothetical protein